MNNITIERLTLAAVIISFSQIEEHVEIYPSQVSFTVSIRHLYDCHDSFFDFYQIEIVVQIPPLLPFHCCSYSQKDSIPVQLYNCFL